MLPLANYTSLIALGLAIIQSLWQFAAIWLAYSFIVTLFNLAPRQKYVVAVAGQFIGLLWFICTYFFYLLESNATLLGFISIISQKSGLLSFNAESLLPYLAVAYLVSLVFFFAKWILSYRYTTQLRIQGLEKPGVEWRLFVEKKSRQLGIKNKVGVYLSKIVTTPLTIGFLKPVILIPMACVNQLDTVQMEAILLHELAHIKRHDYFINLLLSISEMLLFFNPFMHLISSEIKKERENCCDDLVLHYQYNPAVYASALLAIAAPDTQLALALYATGKKQLLSRIKRMLQPRSKLKHNYKSFALACFAILFFVANVFQSNKPSTIFSSKKVAETVSRNNFLPAPNKVIDTKENKGFKLVSYQYSLAKSPIKKVQGNREIPVKNKANQEATEFENDFTAYLNDIEATKNIAAIEQLKTTLPEVVAKLNQEIGLTNDNATRKKELNNAVSLIQEKLKELENYTQTYSVASLSNFSTKAPAVLVMPSAMDEEAFNFNLFNQHAAKPALPDSNNAVHQTDKLIIIELPSSIGDTSLQSINSKGRVLKITRI